MTGRDALLTRLLRGALEQRRDPAGRRPDLAGGQVAHRPAAQPDRDLARPEPRRLSRQARLRTLLPIFCNVIFVVLAVVAVMMALSALGVEIGRQSGAGIVGVAVGWLADAGQGRVRRRLLSPRRRLPGRPSTSRVALQGNGGIVRVPVGESCGITAGRSSRCRSGCWGGPERQAATG